MKNTAKKVISLISVIALMLTCVCLFASAERSHIEIDGEAFNGTFEDAIAHAQDNSVIEIVGTV
ncbi:MAG: hypothetical protein MJ177_08980, partial [Clostridia bacterium]|nr:hypothetical protein [Clostridia bacterium]